MLKMHQVGASLPDVISKFQRLSLRGIFRGEFNRGAKAAGAFLGGNAHEKTRAP
jgi:hypothetical protein